MDIYNCIDLQSHATLDFIGAYLLKPMRCKQAFDVNRMLIQRRLLAIGAAVQEEDATQRN